MKTPCRGTERRGEENGVEPRPRDALGDPGETDSAAEHQPNTFGGIAFLPRLGVCVAQHPGADYQGHRQIMMDIDPAPIDAEDGTKRGIEGSCGPAAKPAFHSEAVAQVQTQQREVRRSRYKFKSLHRVKDGVELGGPRLGREEQRGGNEN